MVHAGWSEGQGFTPVKSPDGKGVVQAVCNECQQVLTRRDLTVLVAHANKHTRERLLLKSISQSRTAPSDQTPPTSKARHQPSAPRQLIIVQAFSSHQVPEAENLNLEPPRKRSSTEKLQKKNKSLDIPKAKINEVLLKLLFTWERKYDDVNWIHLKVFLKALCPSYFLPSPEYLKNDVLGDAAGMIVKDYVKKEKSHFLWVQELKVKEKIVLISALIGVGQYIYIDFTVTCDLCKEDFEEFWIEGFQPILEDLDQLTVEEFWRNARCSYPNLSNVAFSLLHVPALPKSLVKAKLTFLAETEHDELDPDSVLMLLTVQLEQL
ncbi:hypothetical protein QAD02_011698 [Eretmocerus hayati]|uniref:Uncharacterized protein n=1 Tax=Eretmocerus hayati TaxID=131215 RepID=A0ACC2P0C9_9HYME|nr:hypothetical protein QAD02_011698 [Eretmocerus hayati]